MIKDIVKDTDEQPNEEVNREKYRRAPHIGASLPVESVVLPSQHVDAVTNLPALWAPFGGF